MHVFYLILFSYFFVYFLFFIMAQFTNFSHLFLFLVLTAFNTYSQIHQNSISQQSIFVTTFRVADTDSRVGSLEGGAIVTISGYGFDKNTPSNNKVYFGDYPCLVLQATRYQIKCQTTPYKNSLADSQPLNLQVIVGRSSYLLEGIYFYYLLSQTQKIQYIHPSTLIGTRDLLIYGVHNIYVLGNGLTKGDNFRISIAGTICGRQGYPVQYYPTLLKCTLQKDIEAGKYNLSHWTSRGYAYYQQSIFRRNLYRNQSFHVLILPKINKISPSSGTGNMLKIQGTGFTTNSSRMNITIDGHSCEIKSSNQNRIDCFLSQYKNGPSSIIQSNTTQTQQSGYIAGSGWNYSRYTTQFTGQAKNLRSYFMTNVTVPPAIQSVKADLYLSNLQSTDLFLDVYKGYFKSKQAGQYIFKCFANSKFAMYISPFYGSADIPSDIDPIIWSNQNTGNSSHITFQKDKIISDGLFMEQDKYYYIQLYHYFSWNNQPGFLKVSVQIPNKNSHIPGQVYSVQRFTTSYTPDPEVIVFTQSGAISGTITLSLTRQNSNFQVVYSHNATISFNESIDSFLNALRGFSGFSQYPFDGQRLVYDAYDNDITNLTSQTDDYTDAYTYKWRVYIYKRRNIQHTREVLQPSYNLIGQQNFVQQIEKEYSSLISGTFSIQIGGETLLYQNPITKQLTPQLPYNIDAASLQAAFRRIPDLSKVKVTRDGIPEQSANWTIFFQKYNAQPPQIIFTLTNLEGGKEGTSPTIDLKHLQKYKENIVVDIIDYNFLYLASDQPKVIITVDDKLMSVCSDSSRCGYTYDQQSPKVAAILFTPGSPNIILSVSISNGYALNSSSFYVVETNSGNNCIIPQFQQFVNVSNVNITCQLQTNQNLTPRVYTGQLIFSVFVSDIGYLQISPSYRSIRSPLLIASISPNQSTINGGEYITVTGLGFYENNKDLINVTLCGERAQIISASNTQIVFQAPSCQVVGLTEIKIRLGSQSNNLHRHLYIISSQNLTLVSVSPLSMNPAIKRPIQVIGQGFGFNKEDLKVTIKRISDGKLYRLKILKINNTFMQVGFTGSLPGKYKLSIKKLTPTPRYFSPLDSSLVTITVGVFIHQVYPNIGSPYGGTLITIKGQNFSPELIQNIITIGQEQNMFCDIKSLNTTHITCRTPYPPENYGISNQSVYSLTKITEEALCINQYGCIFSYESPLVYQGPKLLDIGQISYNRTGQIVKLVTNNQSTWISIYNIIIKNIITKRQSTVSSPTSVSDISLTFQLPDLQSGIYDIFIQTDYGYSNSMQIQVQLILSQTSCQLSQNGGLILLDGYGFPQFSNSTLFKFRYTSQNPSIQIHQSILPQSSSTKIHLLISTSLLQMSGQWGRFFIDGPLNSISLMINFVSSSPIDYELNYTQSPGVINFSMKNLSQVVIIRAISISLPQLFYDISNIVSNGPVINFNSTLMAGGYKIWVGLKNNNGVNGWHQNGKLVNISRPMVSLSNLILGKNGGLIQLPSSGFAIGENTIIKINNQIGKFYKTLSNNSLFYIPPQTKQIQSQTNTSNISNSEENGNRQGRSAIDLLNEQNYQFSYISDRDSISPRQGSAAFDNNLQDRYYSTNTSCYVGIKLKSPYLGINLLSIILKLQQNILHTFRYLVVEGSNDGVAWDMILNITGIQFQRSNNFKRSEFIPSQTYIYTHLRIRDTKISSKCQVDYIAFKGELVNQDQMQSDRFDLEIIDGYQNNYQLIPNAITYNDNATPIVQSVLPKTGHYLGAYNLTITGINLQGNQVNVTIDSVPCHILSSNYTTIICQVQQRPEGIQKSYFQVLVDNSFAILNQQFMYVQRWSDQSTWGLSFKPTDGDLVHVPKGQVLWVDQSTPNLQGIVVEGKIIFSDQIPMTITTNFITINRGQFVAGTQEKPYQNDLNFRLTGNQKTIEQPIFGTKVIGCQSCKFSMHARGKSNFRWASLKTPIISNTTSAFSLDIQMTTQSTKLMNSKILVTSTSYSHKEIEIFTVNNVSASFNNISIAQIPAHDHFANLNIEGTTISGQVGILQSNIKISGVDNENQQNFGAKLIMRGQQDIDGSYFKVSNIQITKCGQINILSIFNQPCITILNTGPSSNSYIRNSSIYSTYSGGVHFSNQLSNFQFSGNLLYNTTGHSIYFEDLLAYDNVILNNLILEPRGSWRVSQIDIIPACIYLRGPMNVLMGNHLAGGDHYGIWYNLDSREKSQCAWGLKYNQKSRNNYIHSFASKGLYIDKISNSNISCGAAANPTRQFGISYSETEIKQYICYRNNIGIAIQQSDYLTISSSLLVQNKNHIYIYQTNLNYIENVNAKISNVAFYGTFQSDKYISRGAEQVFIQLPCSPLINITNLVFGNIKTSFIDAQSGSANALLRSCSPINNYYYSSTDEVLISAITYKNVINALGLKLQFRSLVIVYDYDGSFSQNTTSSSSPLDSQANSSKTVVANFPHLRDPACYIPASNSTLPANLTHIWNNVLICDSSIKIRKVTLMYNAQNWWQTGLNIARISNFSFTNETLTWSSFSQPSRIFDLPYAMDRYYQFFIGRAPYQDFTSIQVQFNGIYKQQDGGILFRHTYQNSREIFEVKNYLNGGLITPSLNFQQVSQNAMSLATCNIGDFYHSNQDRLFGLCLSNKNTVPKLYTRISAFFCRYQCPQPDQPDLPEGCDAIQQSSQRIWSNASMWPNSKIPGPGDNVTIPAEWKVLLDVDHPAPINIFIIKGTLIIPDSQPEVTIIANSIWVQGTLKAGSPAKPFVNNFNIVINGSKTSLNNIVVDSFEKGNKMITVTGLLSLYGSPPGTTWTRLTEILLPGANSMNVFKSQGWKQGDELVIGPSFNNASETQYVKIIAINGSLITFSPKVNFTHYGSSTFSTQNGIQLDSRAGVGHLTRNIKIKSIGSDSWGYRMLVYGYSQCDLPKIGVLKLSGVQLMNGGQQFQSNSKPTIQFKRLTQGIVKSQILSSAIHHCNSRCIGIQNSKSVKLNNNLFASAVNMHIQVIGVQVFDLLISYNFMVDVKRANSSLKKVACFEWKNQVYQSTTSNSQIVYNLCQGSTGAGFSRYYQNCNKVSNSVYGSNSVGSASIGHLLFGQIACSTAQKLIAFSCDIGVLGNPKASELVYSKLVIIDSLIGVGLKMVGKNVDQTATIKDSFISAIYRPFCKNCYGQALNKCTNMIAVSMLTSTQTIPPMWKLVQNQITYNLSLVDDLSQASFDSKSFIINSRFSNYKNAYTEISLKNICYNNIILSAHAASSQLVGSQHFYSTTCTNCFNSSVIKFTNSSSQSLEEQEKACGSFPCTGRYNFYVEDHTGDLFGLYNKGTLIPNYNALSQYLGGLQNNQKCTWLNEINGYQCKNDKIFYVLQFESIGNDSDSRVLWPVYFSTFNYSFYADTYYNYNYMYPNNTKSLGNATVQNPYEKYVPQPEWLLKLNAYRQWNTQTSKPTRLNRFISLLLSNNSYNLSFNSIPPRDFRLQFQRRQYKSTPANPISQNYTNWMILKIYYSIPNSIRLQVNGKKIDPVSVVQNNREDPLLNFTNICGAHKYYFKHRTIDLVINNRKDCRPRLTVTNSVQLTAKFNMDINDFYALDGKTLFIDKMVALLGIDDRSRVKVVGIYRGSVTIQSFIQDSSIVTEEEAKSGNYRQQAIKMLALSKKIDEIYNSGEVETALKSVKFGDILVFNQNVRIFDVQESKQNNIKEEDQTRTVNMQLAIGALAGLALLSIVTIVCCLIYRRRKNRIQNEAIKLQNTQQTKRQKKQQIIAAHNLTTYIEDLD